MSRRTLGRFDYFYPESLDDVFSLIDEWDDDAFLFAGGTDVFPLMRDEVISPKALINLKGIPELGSCIEEEDGNLVIGAITTVRDVEVSEVVEREFMILHEAAGSLGSLQVRNLATVGGNLGRASPSADVLASLYALDTKVSIVGPKRSKEVPITKFCTGPGETCLTQGEIIKDIRIPKLPENSGSAFIKIGRTGVDLAKINLGAVVILEDGKCVDARISVGAAAPTPIRAGDAENILVGSDLEEEVIEKVADAVKSEVSPISDVRSTADYRRKMSVVLTERAVKRAVERV